jgi:hypothetical protein
MASPPHCQISQADEPHDTAAVLGDPTALVFLVSVVVPCPSALDRGVSDVRSRRGHRHMSALLLWRPRTVVCPWWRERGRAGRPRGSPTPGTRSLAGKRGGAEQQGGAALGEEKGRWLGAAAGRGEQIREQKGRNRKVAKGASAEKEGGGRKGDRRGEGEGSLGGG